MENMQITWISLQTDNHASTSPLSFYRPDALPAAKPTASKHWRQPVLGLGTRQLFSSVASLKRYLYHSSAKWKQQMVNQCRILTTSPNNNIISTLGQGEPVNQHDKHRGQRSFSSGTHTHTGQNALPEPHIGNFWQFAVYFIIIIIHIHRPSLADCPNAHTT